MFCKNLGVLAKVVERELKEASHNEVVGGGGGGGAIPEVI